MRYRKNKLGNKKIETPFGTFDSKAELERFYDLHFLLQRGSISNLERQVVFHLIPPAREILGEYTKGPRKGQTKYGKTIERGVDYVADFVYIDTRTGEKVVEDVKGFRDTSSAAYKVFIIKRKLMLWIHGIHVKEV